MKRIFSEMKSLRYALLAFAATALLLGGCGGGGGSSYDEPKVGIAVTNAPLDGHATNVVIKPATLLDWMKAGVVNSTDSFKSGNVVILDYASGYATYPAIPGAVKVTTAELAATRLEGIAETGTLVPTGEMMDLVIKRAGITSNTTIVFTSDTMFYAARAYFIFRYWGFPQSQLKFLDGGNRAWKEEIPSADLAGVNINAAPQSSNYSVKYNARLRDDLRMSIGEMISEVVPALADGRMLHLDALGLDHADGTTVNADGTAKFLTTDLIDTTKYAVFEGRINGSKPLGQGTLYTNDRLKSADDIRTLFLATGWTDGLPTSVACRAGVSCNTLFLALDAVLGSPVYTYDGSWGQWGLYSNDATKGGRVPADLTGQLARWATDQYTISGPLAAPILAPSYNLGKTRLVNNVPTAITLTNFAPSRFDTGVIYGTDGPEDPAANQVESEDRVYMTTPSVSGPSDSTSGGGAQGC